MKLKEYRELHPRLFTGKRFVSSKSKIGTKIALQRLRNIVR